MDLPSEDALRFVVKAMARVRAAAGDILDGAPLVLPTGEFFPDAFERSPAGIATFLERMRSYTPISADLPLQIAFTDDADGGASCGAGACCAPGETAARGGVVDTDDGYGVVVHTGDSGAPELLAASLARALGAIVLAELDVEAGEKEAAGEVAAIAMGLGVLVTEGASVYKKGCGGMREHRATALDVGEATVALALFARISGEKPQTARANLGTTQREAFDLALAWVDSNSRITDLLRDSPELLEDGVFEMENVKGLVGRLLSRSKSVPAADAPASHPRRERSKAEEDRLAEARALVEDALGEN